MESRGSSEAGGGVIIKAICNMDCFYCIHPDCINDKLPKARKLTKEQREMKKRSQHKWYKKNYEARKVAGLCVACGKEKARPNRTMCGPCAAAQNRRKLEAYYRKTGGMPRSLLDGVERCAVCGKAPPAHGSKTCEKCYETLCKNAAKARAAHTNNPNHPYREVQRFWTLIIAKREQHGNETD